MMMVSLSLIFVAFVAASSGQEVDPACGTSSDAVKLFQEAPVGFHIGCINQESIDSFLNAPVLVNEVVDCYSESKCKTAVHSRFAEQLTNFIGDNMHCSEKCGEQAGILNSAAVRFSKKYGPQLRKMLRSVPLKK